MQDEIAGSWKAYTKKNKKASTSASKAAFAKLEIEFKTKIKLHTYEAIGGYDKYCQDLDGLMKEYEATKGLGLEVIREI